MNNRNTRHGYCRIGLTLGALLLTASCGSDNAQDYFPLGGDQVWDYEIRRSIKGEQHKQRLILTSLPAANIEGAEYFPQLRIDDRVDVFSRTPDGITRVNFDKAGPPLSVLPAQLKPKATWQAPGQILFLEITGAFHATFQERKKLTIDLDYTIEAMDDTVTVSAGRYSNCMRVKSSGSMFAGATLKEFLGIDFIQIEQTEWYAPGVGLVKRVRTESTTPADWNNQFEQELVALE